MAIETQNVLNRIPIEPRVPFQQSAQSDSQQLVEALCNLVDCVRENEECIVVPLAERSYLQLAERLDALVDIVGEDGSHPLAPLMEFVGTFIKIYEDEHVPEPY
ncbi:hypothetical protein C6495_18835 [Candidatus Poribacteria bacterium]|nr:MAG: hypothetical protein C6495_18835 [Candidatus Poribacteria bacterium]